MSGRVFPAAPARMPDFTSGTHAGHHTLDSALASLAALRVSASRIHIRTMGRDAAPPGTVLRQTPPAGEVLTGDVQITLEIAGLGFIHALPAGLWESGGEAEPGTRELLEPLDDPLRKLEHWSQEGASLFHITAENPGACARWLALFGLRPEEWPSELWYRLATLLPNLPVFAGTEDGIRLALGVLFELPVQTLRWLPSLAVLDTASVSRLGATASRLGVDAIVGDAVEELAHLSIALGPVSLSVYDRFVHGPQREWLARAFDLLLPAFVDYEISWAVLDARRRPRLGLAEENSRLGVNSHLGEGRLTA